MVIQVTKHDESMTYVTVTITHTCDTEKNIENTRTDNII